MADPIDRADRSVIAHRRPFGYSPSGSVGYSKIYP